MNIKQKLDWSDLRMIGKFDKANRWYPSIDVAEYFTPIRGPSRAWPHSYAKAAMTKKFANWLKSNHPALAEERGL